LNWPSSVVKRSESSASSSGSAAFAGRRPRSIRNISCSAPMRRTPLSIRPRAIISSSARTSSSSARTKLRISTSPMRSWIWCSPMDRVQS
jgi:hypothetical protein